jgi:hypothetical protein
MLGSVVVVFGAFAFLVWNSYRTGARRLAALQENAEPERNRSELA